MKKMSAGRLAVLVALVATVPLLAHHGLTNFDTTKAVRVKGTVVQFHRINPHSFIFLDERDSDGQVHHWAVQGPPVLQLERSGFAKDVLKAGDVVEVCGYLPKEAVVWQIASPDSHTNSPSGRLINGEALVMPDGKQQSWGDYGVHKCFAPGYTDQHSPR